MYTRERTKMRRGVLQRQSPKPCRFFHVFALLDAHSRFPIRPTVRILKCMSIFYYLEFRDAGFIHSFLFCFLFPFFFFCDFLCLFVFFLFPSSPLSCLRAPLAPRDPKALPTCAFVSSSSHTHTFALELTGDCVFAPSFFLPHFPRVFFETSCPDCHSVLCTDTHTHTHTESEKDRPLLQNHSKQPTTALTTERR